MHLIAVLSEAFQIICIHLLECFKGEKHMPALTYILGRFYINLGKVKAM